MVPPLPAADQGPEHYASVLAGAFRVTLEQQAADEAAAAQHATSAEQAAGLAGYIESELLKGTDLPSIHAMIECALTDLELSHAQTSDSSRAVIFLEAARDALASLIAPAK